jgi:hypothetical protein
MSDELDPALRSLLDASNAADALPEHVRRRVWARVETATAAPTTTWVKPTVVALALAAGVSALWFGASAMRESTRVVDGAAVYERGEVDTAPATAAIVETAPAELPAEIPAVDAEPVRAPVIEAAPAVQPKPRARAAAPEPAPLVDEIGRLRAAQAALRKDPVRTLELLDALDRDAPKGMMIPERAALRVFATCATGDEGRARKLGETFAKRHPTSPLLDRVRSTCAPEEKTTTD